MATGTCKYCSAQFEYERGERGALRKRCDACIAARIRPTAEQRRVRSSKRGAVEISCEQCGRSFIPADSRHKYCGRECALKAWHARRQAGRPELRFTCTYCKREYNAKAADRNKYCSRQCKFAHLREQSKGEWIHWWFKDCAICGKRFIGRRSARLCGNRECELEDSRRKSREHLRQTDKRDRSVRQCRECGTPFEPEYGNKHRLYCSHECCAKATRRVSKRKRRAIERGVEAQDINPNDVFERDGWRCHLCGHKTPRRLRGTQEDRAPEMDHITPLALGGSHTMNNVACACRRCNLLKGAKALGQLRLSA